MMKFDADDVAKRDALSAGGIQSTNHINESGLYALIFGSTKPDVKRFKRWVTSEVLASIRKSGQYQLPKPATQKAETVKQPVPAIYANFPKEVQSIFMLVSAAEAACLKGGAK